MKVHVFAVCGLIGWVLLAESNPSPTDAILANYCAAASRQDQLLRGASMDVEISGSLPKLQKQGKLRALRRITSLGRITYEALGFQGDNTIKKEVINRYLQQEADGIGDDSIAITPQNYKFKYKGASQMDGRDTYVFQVSPRKKRERLYKGELWIDAATYLPVREAGKLVKTPMGVRGVKFMRSFDIENGIAVPRRLESETDVWFFGKAQLTINFANFSIENAIEEENQDR